MYSLADRKFENAFTFKLKNDLSVFDIK